MPSMPFPLYARRLLLVLAALPACSSASVSGVQGNADFQYGSCYLALRTDSWPCSA
jgi:hypothetical protein